MTLPAIPLDQIATISSHLGSVALDEVIKITVQKSIQQARAGLNGFAGLIKVASHPAGSQVMPSAALLGLGRCGTNICLEVARQLEEVITDEDVAKPSENGWISRLRFWETETKKNPYLFQPVILLADADFRNSQAHQLSNNTLLVPGYDRCLHIDMEDFYKHGSGHIPQVGQYVARVMLNSPIKEFGLSERSPSVGFPSKLVEWSFARSYFLDTIGLAENATRLMIFVFSMGGGSGSGLSLELGAAQRFLMLKRATEALAGVGSDQKLHLEPCFSLGLGIMPEFEGDRKSSDSREREAAADVEAINTGRNLVSYLSRLQRYRTLDIKEPRLGMRDIPPFDCQLLISNGVMSSLALDKKTPFTEAARAANVYMSQHLFNLLLAQSLPSDYANQSKQRLTDTLKDGGITGGELGRIDGGDLATCLFGLAVAGYAETKKLNELDFRQLVINSVAPPTWNADTSSIDGVSLLPKRASIYEQSFQLKSSEEIIDSLIKIPLFKKALSVVVIISVPTAKESVLRAQDVSTLKETISMLFPKASNRRFIVIPDSGETVSLGMFICGSAHMASECVQHIHTYALNCFCSPGYEGTFISKLNDALLTPQPDFQNIGDQLRDRESIGALSSGLGDTGAFVQRRTHLEARSVAELGERLNFGDMLLTKQDFLDALYFMRDGIAFGGPKTAPPEDLTDRI